MNLAGKIKYVNYVFVPNKYFQERSEKIKIEKYHPLLKQNT